MKPFRSKIKWLLAVAGLLFALIILKIVLVLTAKPKITVDYVAEYNRITRPANYDPNDNAAPYYQKAFDAFVEMPEELHYQQFYNQRINWPADFNSVDQTLLESWLASNSNAFEFFKLAANKPYYWLERHVEDDNDMFKMLIDEIVPLKYLTNAVMWNTKLAALKGQPQIAFENIIDCYKTGCQKCKTPSSLTEQLEGMSLKGIATNSTLLILDKTQIDSTTLKSFQTALQAELDKDNYVLDFEADKLTLYDAIQRTFADNGWGYGRLAWSKTAGFSVIHYGWTNTKMQLFNCFFGPTRKQTIEQIENLYALYNQITTKTPWQIKKEERDYFGEIDKINNSNFFLEIHNIGQRSIFNIYYKSRVHRETLVSVLAILRFKADNHRLPASLDELASAGYLQSVPMDPYSDGALVYKPDGDNFKLYSVGENFTDDSGNGETKKIQTSKYSYYYEPAPDIVYWPVNKFKDAGRALYPKDLEKLRAAKEADVLGTAQDQNSSVPNK